MPPHSLLRTLRHRSTPTLPSEHAERPPVPMIILPSIFITIPFEEGGHFWCLYPGSASPHPNALLPTTPGANNVSFATSMRNSRVNGTASDSFDVPLPDFKAIEDAIDRLRRAGETPTFRRPKRSDEVVLPKKKHALAHGNEQNLMEAPQPLKSGKWGRRPKTPPFSFPASKDEETVEGKKKKKARPPPLTSISYESIVSQPFSPTSPEAFYAQVSSPKDSESKRNKKRSSLGWLFNNKRPSVRKGESNTMGVVFESERHDLEEQDVEVTLDRVVESAMPNSPGAESTATVDSDVHKPLPPLPPSTSISQDPPTEELSDSEIAKRVELIVANYLAKELPNEPIPEVQENREEKKDSSESSQATTSTPTKIKRKFSLKRLRERFLSSPSAPPVPELPTTTTQVDKPAVGIAGVPQPIDPPFTPPPIPSLDSIPRNFPIASTSSEEVAHFLLSSSDSNSGPIDPPFTPPSIPSSSSLLNSEQGVVIAPPLLLKDEEVDLSTSSEDSSNTTTTSNSSGNSDASTPESSPPDTPAHVQFGPVFGIRQGSVDEKMSMAIPIVDIAIVEKRIEVHDGNGITRSNGVRTKLASLHFDQIDFDTTDF
jgi:hypothetical protein